jgi:hypothetical protein
VPAKVSEVPAIFSGLFPGAQPAKTSGITHEKRSVGLQRIDLESDLDESTNLYYMNFVSSQMLQHDCGPFYWCTVPLLITENPELATQ